MTKAVRPTRTISQLRAEADGVEPLYRRFYVRNAGPRMDQFCETCLAPIRWVSCPTGGWWAHVDHPSDGHDAVCDLVLDDINDQGIWVDDA